MLRTRLWMGATLIALVAGMLAFDRLLDPWYPFLYAFVAGLSLAATFELLALLPAQSRPRLWLCVALVQGVIAVNWAAHLVNFYGGCGVDPWRWLFSALGAAVLIVFLVEMATFSEPGESVQRMALAVWVVGYLAVLPSL